MTKKQKKLLQRITAAAVLFAAGMLLPLFAEVPAYIIFALFGISYIIIGWDIIWKAFCNIRQGEAFDENFLMTVATTGAFALGEYSEGVAVMLFYQIGEWFQSYAVSTGRTRAYRRQNHQRAQRARYLSPYRRIAAARG